ncbi:TetR/AcrR family transcriptional regulator [Actinotalea sp.]|uniref:TetR/AcrR family transcriptional regulator n=1 Tax=Actinotalea sp. TaxID=1872145 RepID=UPI003563316A
MPRAGLSRAAVVTLALEVVDTEGFAGLTLAAVAARAGVAVPSLYKHVGGLPDLRRAVALRCVEEFTAQLRTVATTERTGPPDERAAQSVRALARAVRAFALAHPGRYAAVQGGAWAHDPGASEIHEAAGRSVAVIAKALEPLGLAPRSGAGATAPLSEVDAVRTVRALVHGFVMLELDGGFGLPDDVERSFERALDLMIAGFLALRAEG